MFFVILKVKIKQLHKTMKPLDQENMMGAYTVNNIAKVHNKIDIPESILKRLMEFSLFK